MSGIFSFRYHEFSVPLDWAKPDSNEKTTIIVREILEDDNNRKPTLLYFQGGPGFGVRFPTDE